MCRILVVGTSGSGKTTIAQAIAARTGVPHFASDDFYWEQDWKPAPIACVDRLLDEVLAKSSWVLDGNFEHRWETVWNQADLIVWLDYSLPTVLWQVARRNVGWFLSRRIVWSGNRMTLYRVISGVRHSLQSHCRKRNVYPRYLDQLRHSNVVCLSSRGQTSSWVESLGQNLRTVQSRDGLAATIPADTSDRTGR